ncbi:hypothetical protein C8J56DRAFT_931085 [Mycena floridula]|nr:hypothetical protein C8J56DRAFT_931085 [Mycena floridula]
MRLSSIFPVFTVLAVVLAQAANESTVPEIDVVAAWNENNVFGHVVNGEKNQIKLSVENKSDRNVTLIRVGGSILNAETETLIKNITAQNFNVPLIPRVKMQVPFAFYSEFKPGDVRLKLWLEHKSGDEKFLVSAFDSIVTVVEPAASIFDFKMITTYMMVAAILGGLGYMAFVSFIPQPKKTRAKKVVAAPVEATGSTTGYSEEWIPEHHLRKGKKPKSGNATSGDELSGAETSGAESSGPAKKARKGKK